MTKFCTQSAFAKRYEVTAQTVARWARSGLVKLAADGRRVAIEASEELLANRPRRSRGNNIVGEAELAELLDVSERQLRDLAARKIAVRVGRGRYDKLQSTRNYIHHLRCVAAACEDGLSGNSYVDRQLGEGGST